MSLMVEQKVVNSGITRSAVNAFVISEAFSATPLYYVTGVRFSYASNVINDM